MENKGHVEISHKIVIDKAFCWWYELTYSQREKIRSEISNSASMTIKQILKAYNSSK